ncbi:major facilitator superfamily domain-containing protein [Clohesyomyces aquaticus]|uniref:Major facilitator superfamily domain-containing protein n=1 Tax=Clohesyomyces aquaticus TaxID=1231657 RepID=A0A1Y2A9X4_9PLEO|nr:major facilitator superfamily domain-containing protein [Clohesyomyces aquaticus]
MALVLATCNPANIKRIASSFPSVELLDSLIQYFLTSPSLGAKQWFHLPTFSPSRLRPELLASVVAAGAVSTPDIPLRKLGYALQEASRIGQGKSFEEDNSLIRDLQMLQNQMLQLEIGLWSGISRKMEISESFFQPLVTMLRRGGRFRRTIWKDVIPDPHDEGQALENKWRQWVAQETYLRLVYRIFEQDRQSSMALLKQPLISYTEMGLPPLLHAEDLWYATTAQSWKAIYFSGQRKTGVDRPSLSDCLVNLDCLNYHETASIAFLHMIWGMVWEYRQMATLGARSQSQVYLNNSLVMSTRHQELTKLLDDFRVSSSVAQGSNSAVDIFLELMLVHLNAPLEELQLFAGIEGQEEARRVYPALRDWVLTPPAREAMWHAGQVLRAARGLHKGLLRNFNAIAVYHAGLIFWGYGFLKRCFSYSTNVTDQHLEWTASQQPHDELRLVPQPSSDPADPLNFPAWRKTGIMFCMALLPWVVNFTSASISVALPIYASTPIFGLPPKGFSQLTQLSAINVLMLGASNLWWVPLANTFGRRPIVLLSLLLLTFSSMWAGLATSFNSLLVARFFMGCGGGPSEAIAPDVVADVFFVHQQGRAMAIYTVALSTGSLMGSICGSYIVAAKGIPWLHWVNVILSAITLIFCFFLQPETLYDRVSEPIPTQTEKSEAETKEATTHAHERHISTSYQPYTFGRSLKAFIYRSGIAHRTIGPFSVLRLPGVWVVSLWNAGLIGSIVTISIVGAQIVAAPPYLWGHNVGLINVGGIIGALLGCLYTYLITDWFTTRHAKKELHGYSEPESRLLVALPALIIATAGNLVFGFAAQNPAPKAWVGLQFGIGMVAFGLMQAPSVGFNYVIEAYPSLSGDCLVAVVTIKAIVAFAWTFFVGTWVTQKGPAEPFGIFGMLMGVFTMLTIPLYLWGKRLRVATAHWVPEGVGM